MPTDQNNGVNPNQNPTTSNTSTSTNTNQNGGDFDFNLDGVVLEDDTGKDENLSVDNLFDGGDFVSNQSVNNINNEGEKPVDLPEGNTVETPVGQLTETAVVQGVQESVAQNVDNVAEASSNAEKDEDDWLLQEDKAVQESEEVESIPQVNTQVSNNEPVESAGVDLGGLADGLQSQPVEPETPVESVVSNNEPVENTGVDLSGLADGLQSQPVESETPVESVVSNNEPVENTGVDLGGLADGLQSQPVEPETPVESVISNNELVESAGVDLGGLVDGLQSQPVEPETPVESVVSNNEPVENTGVDLSGLADELQSQSVEPIGGNITSDVQSENIVSNTASVSDSLVNVGEISNIVDNGGTELDGPEMVSVDAPAVTPVDAPVNESVENMGIPADSLTIENVGTSVVQDKSGDMVSDTGDFSGKKDGYVPNESEFQKMSTLLDGAKPGQVEIPSEMNTPPIQSQGDETQTQENTKGVFNLDYVVSSLQDSEKNRQNNMMGSNNAVVNNIPENSAVESNIPVDTGAANVAENIPSSVENGPSVQPVVNGVEMVQNNMPQGQGNVAQTQVGETIPQAPIQGQVAPTETMPVQEENSPKKFHNGHTGLIIVLVVICLLGLIGFLMYKMYPDVVSSILGKNNISIEYQNNTSSVILSGEDEDFGLTGDAVEELTGDTELGELLTPDENLTGNDDLTVNKDNQSSGGGLDDVLDPDTLAALLGGNDGNSNIENTGETVSEIHDSPSNDSGDIDTYKDLGLLLDESNSDKTEILKKLNDYKAQGIIYQDWGTENNNQGAYKYGTYIVKKATAMIESIETTGEMDMNEIEKNFNTFDGYLSKLESLK